MRSSKQAFTLIELLVVIAIIAILAAILFPVFAQAKLAAKKTASLSQIKQVGTGTHIYTADVDDVFPLAFGWHSAVGWAYIYGHEVPADWHPSYGPQYIAMGQASWANSTLPYTKSIDLLQNPGSPVENYFGEDFSGGTKKFANVGITYNGLLMAYNASAVASPSQLTLYSQTNGNINMMVYAYANPVLQCDVPDAPCRYVASSPTCSGSRNGEWSAMFVADRSMWVYGNGMNSVMADSSAKFRKVGMNIEGRTDYRTDYYSAYNAQGIPAGQWFDTNGCHSLLFQPDFDFQSWGSPYEYVE